MNYFAHAYPFLDEPYFVAGTSVPDWLNVVDRRVRCRKRHAEPFCRDAGRDVAQLARGIVRHHQDDDAFHKTRAFTELSLTLAGDIRTRLADDTALRPGFLGHILVEILLDAALIETHPTALETFYDRLARVDPCLVARSVGRMTGRNIDALAGWIERFLAERFLFDYTDDAKLLRRLNQVMQRVGLPLLGEELMDLLPSGRERVRCGADALLAATHGPRRTTV